MRALNVYKWSAGLAVCCEIGKNLPRQCADYDLYTNIVCKRNRLEIVRIEISSVERKETLTFCKFLHDFICEIFRISIWFRNIFFGQGPVFEFSAFINTSTCFCWIMKIFRFFKRFTFYHWFSYLLSKFQVFTLANLILFSIVGIVSDTIVIRDRINEYLIEKY